MKIKLRKRRKKTENFSVKTMKYFSLENGNIERRYVTLSLIYWKQVFNIQFNRQYAKEIKSIFEILLFHICMYKSGVHCIHLDPMTNL